MMISDHGIYLDPDELRGIIRGEISFRKCPDCQGEGKTWALHYVEASDPDQDNEQFRDVSDQFAADFLVDNYPDLLFGECLQYTCNTYHGVGYISVEGLSNA